MEETLQEGEELPWEKSPVTICRNSRNKWLQKSVIKYQEWVLEVPLETILIQLLMVSKTKSLGRNSLGGRSRKFKGGRSQEYFLVYTDCCVNLCSKLLNIHMFITLGEFTYSRQSKLLAHVICNFLEHIYSLLNPLTIHTVRVVFFLQFFEFLISVWLLSAALFSSANFP